MPALFCIVNFFFFFNDTATTEIYTLSLHDALPIYIWRADSDNCILGPEIYMPDNLIKEVLDRWSQLDSLSTFSQFLAPYPQLRDHAHQLLDLSEVMQVEFNRLDAAKKAESIAKRQARNTFREDESLSESSHDRSESEEDSGESITPMP